MRTGARRSAFAAARPPNPPPTITTRGIPLSDVLIGLEAVTVTANRYRANHSGLLDPLGTTGNLKKPGVADMMIPRYFSPIGYRFGQPSTDVSTYETSFQPPINRSLNPFLSFVFAFIVRSVLIEVRVI